MTIVNKIIDLFEIRTKRNHTKTRSCTPPNYEIDLDNYIVTCTKCGAYISPFEALITLAKQQERWRNTMNYYREQSQKAKQESEKRKENI